MRIWETASREPLSITFNHCDFHAASPPGACGECPHPLPGQIRRGSQGEELVGPVDSEAPDHGVLTQTWIQRGKNTLPGRPSCAWQRDHVIGNLVITASVLI